MNIHNQLASFAGDLQKLDGKANASWPMASAFNVLLDMAKEEHPDNRIVTAMEPIAQAASAGSSVVDIGTLRVLVGQLSTAIKSTKTGDEILRDLEALRLT
jgi:hypothetical protein